MEFVKAENTGSYFWFLILDFRSIARMAAGGVFNPKSAFENPKFRVSR